MDTCVHRHGIVSLLALPLGVAPLLSGGVLQGSGPQPHPAPFTDLAFRSCPYLCWPLEAYGQVQQHKVVNLVLLLFMLLF